MEGKGSTSTPLEVPWGSWKEANPTNGWFLRMVTIFYRRHFHKVSPLQLSLAGRRGDNRLQGWRGWFETPDMARHSNILNSIEIVLTVGNIFSVEFLSFSYLSSLILHIEKGYGFVEDKSKMVYLCLGEWICKFICKLAHQKTDDRSWLLWKHSQEGIMGRLYWLSYNILQRKQLFVEKNM